MPPKVRTANAFTAAATAQQGVVQQPAKKKRDPYVITRGDYNKYVNAYYAITGNKDIPIDSKAAIRSIEGLSETDAGSISIFNIVDKDHNGLINLEEFVIMCQISKVYLRTGEVPTSLPDAFKPAQQRTTQRKKIAVRTANVIEVTDTTVKSFLSRNDIDVSFAAIFTEAVKNVINIEKNDNEFMTNDSIIFFAKLQQLDYFLRQPSYKDSLIRALQGQNINWIISILMQYDPQVYPEEWDNETQRLTSSIIEKCEPNSVYECPKCHEKKVFSTQRQVRSADEGTTSFFRCCNCGYVWQEN